MRTFVLHLSSVSDGEDIPDVVSLVARDASGQFGILPGRARLVTPLGFGLVRCRTADGVRQFVAHTPGVLHFAGGHCSICTRRYLRDTDYGRIAKALHEELIAEDARLSEMKQSLQRLEEQMLKRLLDLPGSLVS